MKKIFYFMMIGFCIAFPLNIYAQHCPYPHHLYDVSITQVCSEKHPSWTSITYANNNYVHGGDYVKFSVYEDGCSQDGYGSYQRLYHKGGDTEYLNLTLESETETLCNYVVCGRTKIWTTQGADGGKTSVRFKCLRYCAYYPYSCGSQNYPCNWTYSWDEEYIKWRPDDAIQERIYNASSPDTLTIENGIFDETDVYFEQKAIILESQNGLASTTINLDGDGDTLLNCTTGDYNAIVNGFTIYGGATTGSYSSPTCTYGNTLTIKNSKITGRVVLTPVGFCSYPDT